MSINRKRNFAHIDQVLQKFANRSNSSKNIAECNKIAFQDDMESNGLIRKVAFDVYRVDNDPYDGLWSIEEIEGKQYLVRASDYETSNKYGDWFASSNSVKDSVTLSYKNKPIALFSSSNFGFDKDSIGSFKNALLEQVTTDGEFIGNILDAQPERKRYALLSEFPEFRKFVQG